MPTLNVVFGENDAELDFEQNARLRIDQFGLILADKFPELKNSQNRLVGFKQFEGDVILPSSQVIEHLDDFDNMKLELVFAQPSESLSGGTKEFVKVQQGEEEYEEAETGQSDISSDSENEDSEQTNKREESVLSFNLTQSGHELSISHGDIDFLYAMVDLLDAEEHSAESLSALYNSLITYIDNDGTMNETEFKTLLEVNFSVDKDQHAATMYFEQLYELLVINGDERIPLGVLFVPLALFCKGSKSDKLSLIFNMFGTEEGVTKTKMWDFLQSFLKVLFSLTWKSSSMDPLEIVESVDFCAVNAVNAMWGSLNDKGKDIISFDEFGHWYNEGGFRELPWLELLDLRKWPSSKFMEETLTVFDFALCSDLELRYSHSDLTTLGEIIKFGVEGFDIEQVKALNMDLDSMISLEDYKNVAKELLGSEFVEKFSTVLDNLFKVTSRNHDSSAPLRDALVTLLFLCPLNKSDKLSRALSLQIDEENGSLDKDGFQRFVSCFLSVFIGMSQLRDMTILVDLGSKEIIDDIWASLPDNKSSLSFDEFGQWYNEGGHSLLQWLELLDLSKWPIVDIIDKTSSSESEKEEEEEEEDTESEKLDKEIEEEVTEDHNDDNESEEEESEEESEEEDDEYPMSLAVEPPASEISGTRSRYEEDIASQTSLSAGMGITDPVTISFDLTPSFRLVVNHTRGWYIHELVRRGGFKKRTVVEFNDAFRQVCGVSERITSSQFEEACQILMSDCTPDDSNFVLRPLRLLYQAFSHGQSYVELRDIITALSLLACGCKSDKLSATFTLFDHDNDDRIDATKLDHFLSSYLLSILTLINLADPDADFDPAVVRSRCGAAMDLVLTDMSPLILPPREISYAEFGDWYNSRGYRLMYWLELLDLEKWPTGENCSSWAISPSEAPLVPGSSDQPNPLVEEAGLLTRDPDRLVFNVKNIIKLYSEDVSLLKNVLNLSCFDEINCEELYHHAINGGFVGPNADKTMDRNTFVTFACGICPSDMEEHCEIFGSFLKNLFLTLFAVHGISEEEDDEEEIPAVDSRALLLALCFLCSGSKSDKLGLAFRLFENLDEDGNIEENEAHLTVDDLWLCLRSFLAVLATIQQGANAPPPSLFDWNKDLLDLDNIFTSLDTKTITYSDFGLWYNSGGHEILPWLELLDLWKWPGLQTPLEDDDNEQQEQQEEAEQANNVPSSEEEEQEDDVDVESEEDKAVFMFRLLIRPVVGANDDLSHCLFRVTNFDVLKMEAITKIIRWDEMFTLSSLHRFCKQICEVGSREGIDRNLWRCAVNCIMKVAQNHHMGSDEDFQRCQRTLKGELYFLFYCLTSQETGCLTAGEATAALSVFCHGNKSNKLSLGFEVMSSAGEQQLSFIELRRFLWVIFTTFICYNKKCESYMMLNHNFSHTLVCKIFSDLELSVDNLISYHQFGEWYTNGGHQYAPWLELLDLGKWPFRENSSPPQVQEVQVPSVFVEGNNDDGNDAEIIIEEENETNDESTDMSIEENIMRPSNNMDESIVVPQTEPLPTFIDLTSVGKALLDSFRRSTGFNAITASSVFSIFQEHSKTNRFMTSDKLFQIIRELVPKDTVTGSRIIVSRFVIAIFEALANSAAGNEAGGVNSAVLTSAFIAMSGDTEINKLHYSTKIILEWNTSPEFTSQKLSLEALKQLCLAVMVLTAVLNHFAQNLWYDEVMYREQVVESLKELNYDAIEMQSENVVVSMYCATQDTTKDSATETHNGLVIPLLTVTDVFFWLLHLDGRQQFCKWLKEIEEYDLDNIQERLDEYNSNMELEGTITETDEQEEDEEDDETDDIETTEQDDNDDDDDDEDEVSEASTVEHSEDPESSVADDMEGIDEDQETYEDDDDEEDDEEKVLLYYSLSDTGDVLELTTSDAAKMTALQRAAGFHHMSCAALIRDLHSRGHDGMMNLSDFIEYIQHRLTDYCADDVRESMLMAFGDIFQSLASRNKKVVMLPKLLAAMVWFSGSPVYTKMRSSFKLFSKSGQQSMNPVELCDMFRCLLCLVLSANECRAVQEENTQELHAIEMTASVQASSSCISDLGSDNVSFDELIHWLGEYGSEKVKWMDLLDYLGGHQDNFFTRIILPL